MPTNSEQALRIRLKWNDERLLEEFWEEADTGSMEFLPPTPDEIWQIFMKWIAPHREKICNSPDVRYAVEDGDEYAIVAAIADIFGAGGFASATVLVCRYGTKTLCAEHWN